MIRYSLKCAEGHGFESWFQSADAYDKLLGAGMVVCTQCGSSEVAKALMAPRVRPARTAARIEAGAADGTADEAAPTETGETAATLADAATPKETTTALSAPASELERAIAALKKQVEANSDYVGTDFAKQARDMYLGDAPARSIHGEAKLEDAKALIEDGVPVLPLPFAPNRKMN
ncbi:DUF1178 family protein [Phaeobacter sp. B1627]|uniref:DUF1178 family protein n=1 Tax=Phaeobacter sp. B1627 TaxID=2583809 RepID=UPI00111B5C9C|nr:DUF1178 family protein [Phaeobacter sp. B1627]TNJ41987.1 DUF1178 family protein [Phaeobacter sp. B1627]